MTKSSPSYAAAFEKLIDLINHLHIAMFTTVSTTDTLRSRPMATLKIDEAERALWFFTAIDAPKSDEIAEEHQVCVTYASPQKQSYVSISGRAQIIRDLDKARELWTPMAKLWFPAGVEDPRLGLLRVQMDEAEYWDSPSSKVVQLFGMAKGALMRTGMPDLGENVKLQVS